MLRWLRDPDVNIDIRSPTLMKIFFMGELPVASSLDFFKLLNEKYRIGLEALQQTDASITSYQELIPDKKVRYSGK